MTDRFSENSVVLCGRMEAPPVRSHESHGREYLLFPLSVRRLSGTEDRVNVLMERSALEKAGAGPGQLLEVRGVLRTHNNKSGVGSRLVITVAARDADVLTVGAPENVVTLAGTVCKAPVYRRTPLGREICDVMLAVNRRSGRADYLPCILWGESARRAGRLRVGSRLRLNGRIQSRTYIKSENGIQTERTAFEVSAMTLEILEE